MHKYGALCDEFYSNMHLGTEMDLPNSRETILHFFEQIQKRCPLMTNFYSRERGEFCLESEKEEGRYGWISLEPKRILSGAFNPDSLEAALDQHASVLQIAPYELSLSRLDCESLNYSLSFDYNYRGNHNELIAEALGITPALEGLAEISKSALLSYEPCVQIALDEDCRTQCRLSLETRTTAYQIRTGEFNEETFSVFVTLRSHDRIASEDAYVAEMHRLSSLCEEIVDQHVVEQILKPLQKTIALK